MGLKIPEELSENHLKKWQSILANARFCVAVTGAGISKASGIPLLREEIDGVPLQEMFRPNLLTEHPRRYYDVYRAMLSSWRTATPNRAHESLARRDIWVVTLNIDGLHRDAGSNHLIELHGNLRELRCAACGQTFSSQLAWQDAVPRCPGCGTVLRPGITMDGGEVRHFSRALDWVGRADALLMIGTRLQADPVRRLPDVAKQNGAAVMNIHRDAESIVPKLLSFTASEPITSATRDPM